MHKRQARKQIPAAFLLTKIFVCLIIVLFFFSKTFQKCFVNDFIYIFSYSFSFLFFFMNQTTFVFDKIHKDSQYPVPSIRWTVHQISLNYVLPLIQRSKTDASVPFSTLHLISFLFLYLLFLFILCFTSNCFSNNTWL